MALTPFSSRIITDTGVSFGDEGKGRLIPELISELQEQTGEPDPVAAVIKVNGGANSGHTAGGLKLNLLPAGVVLADVPVLGLASGVVADPRKLLWEALSVEARGFSLFDRLRIDERCMVSDLTHRLLDLAWEHYRAAVLRAEPRGSTGRGITPAYTDEVGQRQIYFSLFASGEKDRFVTEVRQRAERAVAAIRHVCQVDADTWQGFFETLTAAEMRANEEAIGAGWLGAEAFDFSQFAGPEPFTLNTGHLAEVYWEAGRRVAANVVDLRELALEGMAAGKYLIGEFGQAYWLDKRHGFSPNVTASHTFTPEFFESVGVPLQPVHNIGCCKAYDTKVGTHLFLTRMPDGHPLAERLKKLEFGTSTGRQRMVGWCDAVEKGACLRYGGFQDLVINKLDALSHGGSWQGGELLICTHYTGPDGERYLTVPRDEALRSRLRPAYRQLPGWDEDLRAIRRFEDLPTNARRYIAVLMESILAVANRGQAPSQPLPNIRYIGVGPDPSEIIRDIPPTVDLLRYA